MSSDVLKDNSALHEYTKIVQAKEIQDWAFPQIRNHKDFP